MSITYSRDWSHSAGVGEEGLAAYAMDTIPEDLLDQSSALATSSSAAPAKQIDLMLAAANPAVVETLQGLGKLVSSRHLPRIQDWLKTFVKVCVMQHNTFSGKLTPPHLAQYQSKYLAVAA